MVSDSALFGAATVGVVIGLVILLYGVSLTAGQSWTAPMTVGGLVSLVAVAVMALRIARLETPGH